MALRGVKVLEFAGLAPAPFCGKILADFGATVLRIDKVPENHLDALQHGKQTLAVNLKDARGQRLVRELVKEHDVLIDPYRPGVMENLNLGPDTLCLEQPRLIYARLSGFGQQGRLAARAGHDINYAAISGVLSMFGRFGEKPLPPINVLADFAGGGLMCAFGICLALLERHNSGLGQIVDAAMIDGAAYVASWLFMSRNHPFWGKKRGLNILDGGAFYYDTYLTKDGRYMSVGALEPQFFEAFKLKLQLSELAQFVEDDEEQRKFKTAVENAFLTKTQAEWAQIFEDIDACVYPVLEWDEVMQHDHHKERDSFQRVNGTIVPKPAPRLSRTPGVVKVKESRQNSTDDVLQLLKECGISADKLQQLVNDRVLMLSGGNAKL